MLDLDFTVTLSTVAGAHTLEIAEVDGEYFFTNALVVDHDFDLGAIVLVGFECFSVPSRELMLELLELQILHASSATVADLSVLLD